MTPVAITAISKWTFNLAGGSSFTSEAEITDGNFALPMIDGLSIPDSTTDQEHVYAMDVSQVKKFWIVSSQDITIESNDGTTPDDTLPLKAGIPYEWDAVSNYHTFKFGTDVGHLHFTNASGTPAIIYAGGTYDSTQ